MNIRKNIYFSFFLPVSVAYLSPISCSPSHMWEI